MHSKAVRVDTESVWQDECCRGFQPKMQESANKLFLVVQVIAMLHVGPGRSQRAGKTHVGVHSRPCILQ